MAQLQTEHGIIYTLTVDDILELHTILCDNYKLLPEMEPVSPPGVKNSTLLESAVSRQQTGSGNYSKYPDAYSNCATLVFGLVKNHCFHNGNKRISFLAMLKHLYVNSQLLKPEVKHTEIYDLLRVLADVESKLQIHALSYNQRFFKNYPGARTNWTSDTDVRYLTYWLRNNTEHKSKKVKLKTIPASNLQDILNLKGLTVNTTGFHLEVVRPIFAIEKLLGKKPFKKQYRINKGRLVHLRTVDDIRRDFNLTFRDGIDNNTFYNEYHNLNEEIVSYKKIIYQLAKT